MKSYLDIRRKTSCTMDSTLLKLVTVFAVFNIKVIQALQLTPNGSVTVLCGMSQQLICTSSKGVTWSKGQTILKTCNLAGVCPSPSLDHYTFSHNGSSFIMTFNPVKWTDNGMTFSCIDTDGVGSSLQMKVKVVPDNSSVVSQHSKSDKEIYLETNCLDSSDSVQVEWQYEDSGTYTTLEIECQEEFAENGSCAANAVSCPGATFKTFRKKVVFNNDADCKLTIRATLTTPDVFYGPQPEPAVVIYSNACIKASKDVTMSLNCCLVAALFTFAALQVIIIILYAFCKAAQYFVLMLIVNYANYVTLACSIIMVGLLVDACPGKSNILLQIEIYSAFELFCVRP
ncbi:uncharacterized protein LOC127859628 [Dreissena polymorpha]|uniref:uncharacterized protein LOC127859628 n=1 Tax=Dreissena polymorpha TaxID=45954 RepID=UPI002263F8F9|nr:uncharacterized protein LOC127859628 [Dreissena polymorpha]